MVKVVLFDLGGVIFKDFFSGGEIGFSKSLGLSPKVTVDAYVKTDLSAYCKNEVTDKDRWKAFVAEVELPEKKIQTCINKFYKSYQIIPEAITFLVNLKKDNKFKFGVLSDQPIGVASYLRKENSNIFSLFDPDLIIISSEVKLSKKDADLKIYKLAIEKSQVPSSEIFFIDNSLDNIENAKSVGMNTFYFDIKNQPILILLKDLQEKLR